MSVEAEKMNFGYLFTLKRESTIRPEWSLDTFLDLSTTVSLSEEDPNYFKSNKAMIYGIKLRAAVDSSVSGPYLIKSPVNLGDRYDFEKVLRA